MHHTLGGCVHNLLVTPKVKHGTGHPTRAGNFRHTSMLQHIGFGHQYKHKEIEMNVKAIDNREMKEMFEIIFGTNFNNQSIELIE